MAKNPAPGQGQTLDPAEKPEDALEVTDFQESDQEKEALKQQIEELKETMGLLKAAVLGGGTPGAKVDREGKLIGETDKYGLDPLNYDDPTARLREEPRLKNVAFDHNYELEYSMEPVRYTNISGVRMAEPKFKVTLNRIILDEDGEKTDKRYIARRLIFHEDPQAAMIIARENGLDIDETNEKQFLNDMRYLRVRDWLFDVFWPKPADAIAGLREEVIGNALVTVFTKSSVDPIDNIPFDKITKKV